MFRIFCLLMVLSFNPYAQGAKESNWLPIVRDLKELEVEQLPRNFRTTEIHASILKQLKEASLPTHGLDELRMIGAGQYNEDQLNHIVEMKAENYILVDLREEVHLLLETSEGQQVAVSAFAPLNIGNEGRSLDEILLEHERYRQHILELGALPLPFAKGDGSDIEVNPPIIEVRAVYTEQEVVQRISEYSQANIDYIYMPITDHKKPKDETVDQFIALMRDTISESESVILFHCRAGRGRTGMMMVMKDILQNAKKHNLSLQQIVERQEVLGSPDFTEISEERSEQSFERYMFLQHFHRYAVADDGFDANASYTEWLKNNPMS